MAKVTGIVTRAASQAVLLTRVPMMRAALPVSARPRCAMALSRLVPPNETSTRVAKLPNTANRVICGSPMTLAVSANRLGITRVARTARIAAGTDQAGSQPGREPGRVSRHRTCHAPGRSSGCRSRSGPAGDGSCTDSAILRSVRREGRHGQRQVGPKAGLDPGSGTGSGWFLPMLRVRAAAFFAAALVPECRCRPGGAGRRESPGRAGGSPGCSARPRPPPR